MIKTKRIRDRLSFDVGGCRAYIEASPWGVTILVCDHIDDPEPASFERDEAVEVLRAMLREIAGPSIDDVREVWGTAELWLVRHDMASIPDLRPLPDTYEVEDARGVAIAPGSPWHQTERAALQAAYDAGMELKGGDDT